MTIFSTLSARRISAVLAFTLVVSFLLNILVLSSLFHSAAQSNLRSAFVEEVSLGTAPTGENDFAGNLLSSGAPVALLQIPKLGIDEVIVEGTDSYTLRSGVGHRRDSVLPGQEGMTVLMGRKWAYGGPFNKLDQLKIGDTFTTFTGQGKSLYKVTGLRKAGDKGFGTLEAGTNHLLLIGATGSTYRPDGVLRVDAELQGKAFPSGLRITKWASTPSQERELGIDTGSVALLVLAFQFLIVVGFCGIWAASKFGNIKTWLVFTPLITLGLILTMDQVTRLLPNLL